MRLPLISLRNRPTPRPRNQDGARGAEGVLGD